MENKEKQIWETPKISDLDTINTESGTNILTTEILGGIYTPS